MLVELDPQRVAAGAYTVYLEFDDGTPATIVYSGYGHFSMAELLGRDVTGDRRGSGGSAYAHAQAQGDAGDEAARKEALRYAGSTTSATTSSTTGATHNSLGLFGLTLVTCARGDLRESSEGLYLYRRGQRTSIPIQDEPRGAAELEELYHAVREGAPLVHDGRWGEATLAVCLAIHEAARTRSEVVLPG
jgi:phthalate 4,5-cis-dihydrodiol dehydrogenase